MGVTRRRILLGTAALVGGGLALRWYTRDPREHSLAEHADVLEPNPFLQITPEGQVIFQLDKVELGQGTMTGMATLVGEDLDFDPARIDVRFAPVNPVFQRPAQMTGESKSMSTSWELIRETGAAAREMLIAAAARRWDVDPGGISTDNGVVYHRGSGQQASYFELAAAAAAEDVPRNPVLKDAADYRWIGSFDDRLDLLPKVTGAAEYGMDVQLPGMLTAVVVRARDFGGRLADYDAAAAEASPGVVAVVPISTGLAVVAESFWQAKRGADAVQASWTPGPLADMNDATLQAQQQEQLNTGEARSIREDGDWDAARADAGEVLEAEYVTPLLAHACMEPMNATVHFANGECDMWVPTQVPDMTRQIACDLGGLPRAKVRVHTTWIGGGFGRRALNDYVVEAVEIALAVERPVKLVWTREDDTRKGFLRQRTVSRVQGAIGTDGEITGWHHKHVATALSGQIMPEVMNTFMPESWSTETRGWLGQKSADILISVMGAWQARDGISNMPYGIPSIRFDQVVWDSGIPTGIWRSVGSSYNAFVVESFVDELAAAAGKDPAELRRRLLAEQPRHSAVLERALAESDWGNPPAGHTQGVALWEAFGSVVCQVAEISLTGTAIRVHRVTCAIDCGQVVNPDIVRQQMESGIIFGLTAALYGEINIDNGGVRQSNFHDYRMLKLAETPAIDVHIIESTNTPSGVGEPGTPPIAPAVANAVFTATGQRLRSLPLKLS